MKTNTSKLYFLSAFVLAILVMLEFYLEREQMFRSPGSILSVIIGLVIGVNMGFKIASMHAARLAEKALELNDCCERNYAHLMKEKAEKERELEITLQREGRLKGTLEKCLRERDEEVKHLVTRINVLNSEKLVHS